MEDFGQPDEVQITSIAATSDKDNTHLPTIWSKLTTDHGPLAPLTDQDCLMVANAANQDLLGAALLRPCGGSAANLFLSLNTAPHVSATTILLGQRATQAAASRGIRLIQCVPPPGQELAKLEPAGFRQLTTMLTLVWQPVDDSDCRVTAIQLQPCLRSEQDQYATMLQETFEGACDFPELNQFQTAREVISEVPAAGCFWIRQHDAAIGTLLMRHAQSDNQLELVYVGILPKLRARGWGTSAVQAALRACYERNPAAHVVVGVDIRNEPAMRMYTCLGFVEVCARPVYGLEVPANG
ncbi:MAG TPA: hypothetical protein DCY79_20885 [Planctomycetaceae bacterium]|nr:hypothetical protein [Blastopirellula sp.]HAY82269.1 hypothetical protein [Planctomycetaceae bacterium]